MVIMAVSDGRPLINSLIPIAIGAVTDLGNILKINCSSKPKLFCQIYVIKIANKDPTNNVIVILKTSF